MRVKILSVVLGTALAAGLVAPSQAQASASSAKPNATQYAQGTPEIIGGTTVPLGSAPWGAQVSAGGFCSGSVIAPQWVLSAAHCFSGNRGSVRVGDERLGQGRQVRVTNTYQRGDTGLMRLATPVNLPRYMPLAAADPPVGAIVEIYGWGGISAPGGPLAKQLKVATVRVTRIQGGQIRAVRVNGTAYHGDSGGPMVYQGRQIGTCTGEGGGELIYPSTTNVLSWIRQITGITPGNPLQRSTAPADARTRQPV